MSTRAVHTWTETTTWWDLAAHYTGNGLNWVHLVYANPHVANPNRVPLGSIITIPEL